MARRYSIISIDVDAEDIIDQIPEDLILDRAKSLGIPDATVLKLAAELSDDIGPRQAAIKAINEIRAGRLADAITTLEREFLPKWPDRDACLAAYLTSRLEAA